MLIVDRERAIVELEGFNDDLGLERPVAAVPRLDLGTGRKRLDPFRRGLSLRSGDCGKAENCGCGFFVMGD